MSTLLYGANVHANGIRQHYLRYGPEDTVPGDTEAVIILPGITSPAVTWGFVGERFGKHFDTYILDIRGRGLSSAEDDLDYSVTAQAQDVIEFAKEVGLKKYSIVGHSMGALIGARAAAAEPEGLTRLVMVDPPVSGPGRREYPSKLDWYVDSIALAMEGCSAEQMREFCPTWTLEQLRLRAQWLHTCNEKAVIRSFNDFHEDDSHQDFAKVKVPTMLMIAERGGVILPEDKEEIQGLIDGLVVTYVNDAGHMIPWDNEEGFYKAFGDFLGARLD